MHIVIHFYNNDISDRLRFFSLRYISINGELAFHYDKLKHSNISNPREVSIVNAYLERFVPDGTAEARDGLTD